MLNLLPLRISGFFSSLLRFPTARTACALVKMIQSNRSIPAIASSSGPKSSGSAKDTSGSTTGIAPRAESPPASAALCAADRVITIRLPAKAFGDASATLPAHFFEDGLRARLEEHSRHVLSQLRSLIWRRGGALLYVLQSVYATNASAGHPLAPPHPPPRAHTAPAS